MALAADIGSALTKHATLPEMMHECAEALLRHLDASLAGIWVLNPEQDILELQACAGQAGRLDEAHSRVPIGALKIGRIAQERQPYLTNDVPSDPWVSDPEWAKREGMVAFAGFPLVVEGRLAGVVGLYAQSPLPGGALVALQSVSVTIATGIERKRVEEALREQTETLETINRIGRLLSAELDQERLVQAVTDAATLLTGAAFGAFFYDVIDEQGEAHTRYAISGAPAEAFERFPTPRNTAIIGPTFRGEAVVRIDDVTKDPRYGQHPPYHGMPPGHPPVRSYLAVPVNSRAGKVLGALFFGHPKPGVFNERAENIAVGLAAQAAIAMDNARLYQEARQSIRVRDEFLSSAAHDLKTPLAGIKGMAQLLLRRAARMRSEEIRQLEGGLDNIDQTATRMTAQINELLDITHQHLHRPLTLDRRATDLIALARSAAEAASLASNRHQISVEAAEEELVGFWDPHRLGRVLDNLLNNAVRYSPSGGAVTVSVRSETSDDGTWAVLAVSDQGIGIPAADLPRVFQRFERARNAVGHIEGTGIGLASVRYIVENHGGTISVESREGEGSTFTVRLPLAGTDEPGTVEGRGRTYGV